jgi:hypothetical protein
LSDDVVAILIGIGIVVAFAIALKSTLEDPKNKKHDNEPIEPINDNPSLANELEVLEAAEATIEPLRGNETPFYKQEKFRLYSTATVLFLYHIILFWGFSDYRDEVRYSIVYGVIAGLMDDYYHAVERFYWLMLFTSVALSCRHFLDIKKWMWMENKSQA